MTKVTNRQFSGVVTLLDDGRIGIEPAVTSDEARCDWFGCEENDWYLKVWRVHLALNEKGMANTPDFENVLLCEKHAVEGGAMIGFLTRQSWEQDLRAARSQAAEEKAIEANPFPCLEEVEKAFKRAHRGRNRTEEAWRLEVERHRAAFDEWRKAIDEICNQAYSRPVTEDDWQKELKRRERVTAYLSQGPILDREA